MLDECAFGDESRFGREMGFVKSFDRRMNA